MSLLKKGGGQSAEVLTGLRLQFGKQVEHGRVSLLYLDCPTDIWKGILMSTVDVTLLVYFLTHSSDVLDHLGCIPLKELADSADEECISCEGA